MCSDEVDGLAVVALFVLDFESGSGVVSKRSTFMARVTLLGGRPGGVGNAFPAGKQVAASFTFDARIAKRLRSLLCLCVRACGVFSRGERQYALTIRCVCARCLVQDSRGTDASTIHRSSWWWWWWWWSGWWWSSDDGEFL